MEKLATQEKMHQLQTMVESIEMQLHLDESVKQALLSVDRELFVSNIFKHLAYNLDALPMRDEQWISSPLTVAKMTQYLEPTSSCDSVLEIGCGSGYQAAILSKLFRRVFTIERIHNLLQEARQRFQSLHISNIVSKLDDGNFGWATFAPFDRIIFSAAPTKIPQLIFDQLAEGGILIAPLESDGLQTITRFYKTNGVITSEAIETCKFVPIVKGTTF